MESPLVIAQRAAIQEARARYERGDISVESFKHALDAVTEAPDIGSVEAIIAELPTAPHSALAALEPAPAALPAIRPAAASGGRGVSRISAFMGETRRVGRPWTLAPQVHISCLMGEALVDLRQARLPAHAHIKVNVTMGETRILIPRGVRVSARTRVIMGEAMTLGENISGLIASGEEEHEPPNGEAVAELEIDARVLMGELRIILADQSSMSISELAQDVLREALTGIRDGIRDGIREGFQQSATQRTLDAATRRAALNPGSTLSPGE
ncbi:MAG TPA: LiaF domain-containing protein [Ktedonobacterales bacterium]